MAPYCVIQQEGVVGCSELKLQVSKRSIEFPAQISGGVIMALLLVVMSFGGHFGQPVPIPTHPPIGQVVPYRPICGNWHRFAKKATKKT